MMVPNVNTLLFRQVIQAISNKYFISKEHILLSLQMYIHVTGWVKCVHIYRELKMQYVHSWPKVVNV